MYVPDAFAPTAEQTAAALRRGGFAYLVTAGPSGLATTPLPLLYDEQSHSMLGHLARANPHWRDADGAESVAVFPGVHGYVSPGYYPPTASRAGMAPTWNYEVLTVHGRLVVHDDVGWLRAHVTALTDVHEADRDAPWRAEEVPARDAAVMLRAIVGIELVIDRVEAKAKLSQNQPEENRRGVVDGLTASGDPGDRQLADRMCTPDRRS